MGSIPNIFIIGAGGIVHDAHLPAYTLAGFNVSGIFDVQQDKAARLAYQFAIPKVFSTLEEMISAAQESTIFDIAVPASQLIPVLQQLPRGAAVLMQKPMGENYSSAQAILQLCREKELVAAVNFQLRYAPFIIAVKEIIREGLIGELCDVEVNVNVYTPWHLWEFLYSSPRVEILYHSIHYIDLIRHLLGTPAGIYAKTVKHPGMPQLASVKSNIIMDYGEMVRAGIVTNHIHQFGLEKQHAYIKLEGTKGAIRIQLGVLMNYPQGVEDKFEYIILKENEIPQWKTREINGSWFPDAFGGSMEQVMQAMNGSISQPDNSVEDAILTMACVEAAYRSSEKSGVKIEDITA